MLSGNGRHRRPRQAPAFVVAAGVTGSAIALPLLAAGSASAADGKTWDRIAECETGGSWSENSGNGYYGGLQMSQEKWEQYGGLEYAASADLASRRQQIEIADKALAAEGVGDWATCGLIAGLQPDKQDGAAGQDDPGAGGEGLLGSLGLGNSSAAPGTSESGTPSGSPSDAPSASATPSPSQSTPGAAGTAGTAGEAADPGSSGAPAGESTASPSAPASPSANGTETADPDKSDVPSASAGTPSEGTGRHRGAPAPEEAAAGASDALPAAGAARGVMDATAGVSGVAGLWSVAEPSAPSVPAGPSGTPDASPSAGSLSGWNQ